MKSSVLIISFLLITITAQAQDISFEDVANELGISFSRDGGFFGGGLSFFDFDGDGMDDISFSSKRYKQIMIFKNSNNTFPLFTNQLGILDSSDVRTILWADYDNDGDKDLFLATYGGIDRLYQNNQNFFTDVSHQVGISTIANFATAAALADYDNDGDIDVYVCVRDDLNPNILYQNQGNGSFLDVTDMAGVGDTIGGTNFFKLPLAVSFFDFNNDSYQDIYIANDKHGGNTLYKNNGDGTFSDVSYESNTGVYIDGMGVAIGDYDNNGFQDIYTTNTPLGNVLLKNNGDETFTDVSEQLNVTVNKTCWGANFFDFDNDTDLDLFVSTLSEMGNTGENSLFENQNDGTFIELSLQGINTDDTKSHGNAIGDFNNDGFCDVVVINSLPNNSSVWQNSGNMNNWVKLELIGVQSNRDGIGSKIEVFNGTEHFIRSTHCGHSYLSQNSGILTIGVGTTLIVDSIIIKWPSGTVDVMRNINTNRWYRVEEGGTITNSEEKIYTAKSFSLEQNYPNPFNPSTKIKYSLAVDSKVTVKIFNILGQEVIELISENFSAGNHELEFNASNLQSGVYFYKLSANAIDGTNFSSVKKMLLAK